MGYVDFIFAYFVKPNAAIDPKMRSPSNSETRLVSFQTCDGVSLVKFK